jgi:hypothetical protein
MSAANKLIRKSAVNAGSTEISDRTVKSSAKKLMVPGKLKLVNSAIN